MQVFESVAAGLWKTIWEHWGQSCSCCHHPVKGFALLHTDALHLHCPVLYKSCLFACLVVWVIFFVCYGFVWFCLVICVVGLFVCVVFCLFVWFFVCLFVLFCLHHWWLLFCRQETLLDLACHPLPTNCGVIINFINIVITIQMIISPSSSNACLLDG